MPDQKWDAAEAEIEGGNVTDFVSGENILVVSDSKGHECEAIAYDESFPSETPSTEMEDL